MEGCPPEGGLKNRAGAADLNRICLPGNNCLYRLLMLLAQRCFLATVHRGELKHLTKWSKSLGGRRELNRRSWVN